MIRSFNNSIMIITKDKCIRIPDIIITYLNQEIPAHNNHIPPKVRIKEIVGSIIKNVFIPLE